MNRVLVVEDHPDIAELLALSLSGLDCSVRFADTLRSGLLELAEAWPDLVLLDLRLPDGSGFEILAALSGASQQGREAQAKPAVVVVSGMDAQETVTRALASGADAYVTKPFAPAHLKDTVSRILLARGPSASG